MVKHFVASCWEKGRGLELLKKQTKIDFRGGIYVKNQATTYESTMKTTGINPSVKNFINHANKEIAQIADDDEELNEYEGYFGIYECLGTLPEELRSLQ